MRVVIIGANGQLGTDLVKVMQEWTLFPLTHADLDICDFERTRQLLTQLRPDVVINTAAYNKVDDAEDYPEIAFRVNTFAVRNLAQICADLNCTLVHISTNYVFDGKKNAPYTEEDLPNPLNVYGVSKLAGEYFVRNICEKHFIIRTAGLYGVAGSRAKGGNFVETMIRLAKEGNQIKVVIDQILTPTYTKDLAYRIKDLLITGCYGLYHITNDGQCSWYEFAATIFEFMNLKPDLRPITSAEFGAKAYRPSYSVLANENLKRAGVDTLRPWPEALRDYLAEKGVLLTPGFELRGSDGDGQA